MLFLFKSIKALYDNVHFRITLLFIQVYFPLGWGHTKSDLIYHPNKFFRKMSFHIFRKRKNCSRKLSLQQNQSTFEFCESLKSSQDLSLDLNAADTDYYVSYKNKVMVFVWDCVQKEIIGLEPGGSQGLSHGFLMS